MTPSAQPGSPRRLMAKSQISSMWPTWWVCNSLHHITRRIESTYISVFWSSWSLKLSSVTKWCREIGVQKNPAFPNAPCKFYMNKAHCGDASGNHITIIPIIRVRNTHPGIMAVVKHHLKLGAYCMTKHTVTRLDITHLMTSICRFFRTCVIEARLKVAHGSKTTRFLMPPSLTNLRKSQNPNKGD